MNDHVQAIMEKLKAMRKEAFEGGNEELHRLLGRVMADVIRVKEHLKSKEGSQQ